MKIQEISFVPHPYIYHMQVGNRLIPFGPHLNIVPNIVALILRRGLVDCAQPQCGGFDTGGFYHENIEILIQINTKRAPLSKASQKICSQPPDPWQIHEGEDSNKALWKP